MSLPDKNGHFGIYGGRFVPDTLFEALENLEKQYKTISKSSSFQKDLKFYLQNYVGRPSPLYFAQNISEQLKLKVYLKREDLNHTGAHKINNAIGQILLAKHMGKKRIIAETGAGQHGVATATVCALHQLKCVVHMGKKDIERQSPNVQRMKLLGAEIIPVTVGEQTLKEATSSAIRDWLENVQNSHYLIGSVVGPHPYPMIVRDFQSIIGREAKVQIKQKEGRVPDHILACVGGGSNAMGIFYKFLNTSANLIAIEAAGNQVQHAQSLAKGSKGVLHGFQSYVLQDQNGQIELAHSISAGLDYPGVGPELSYLKDQKRLQIESATDEEALKALKWLAQTEGIIPALESAHALAFLRKYQGFKPNDLVVVCLSGRGDKDLGLIQN